MSANERDFSDYQLGVDNVYELADGLIPELAERLEVDLGDAPNSGSLGVLVGKLGKNKVLRDNEEVTAMDRAEMAVMLERSGVQKSLSRSLWTPESTIQNGGVNAVVMTGAMPNWQDRIAPWVASRFTAPVYYVTGERVMDGSTESLNPNWQRLAAELDRTPTEADYAAHVIVPRLRQKGLNVIPRTYPGNPSGDQLAANLFEKLPELTEQNLVFARVANAGIQLTVQMRKAAQKVNPNFDNILEEPQAFVFTDTFPIARTADQDADPAHFQKAQNGLRQAVLTAKLLHEAMGGQ